MTDWRLKISLTLDQSLCFRSKDSTIPILSKSEISGL